MLHATEIAHRSDQIKYVKSWLAVCKTAADLKVVLDMFVDEFGYEMNVVHEAMSQMGIQEMKQWRRKRSGRCRKDGNMAMSSRYPFN